MARVEWTRQSGEDVEAVVAMLLCSKYPSAVGVRPSQGDGRSSRGITVREYRCPAM
jgi:hypothetical protein